MIANCAPRWGRHSWACGIRRRAPETTADADEAEASPAVRLAARADFVARGRILRRARGRQDVHSRTDRHPRPRQVFLDALSHLRNLLDASLDMWPANLVAFSTLTSPKLKDRQVSREAARSSPSPPASRPRSRRSSRTGCVPVFVDVDLGTYNVTPSAWRSGHRTEDARDHARAHPRQSVRSRRVIAIARSTISG